MEYLFFLLSTLMFAITLNIFYFSKKHIKTKETKVYAIALVANLIGLVVEISCKLSIYYLGADFVLSYLLVRIYILYLFYFLFIMSVYVYNTNCVYKEYVKVVLSIVFSILGIISLFLPVDIKVAYSTGMANNFVYLCAAFTMLVWFIIIFSHFKKETLSKNIPMIIFIILGIVASIIQNFNEECTLITSFESLILFLMYFTIENPDIKTIENLNVAVDQADRANRAKSDFLSSMSHEIRTPLNAIVGLSSDLASRNNVPSDMKEDLQDIMSASETLLEIVGNILDISKVESEKMSLLEMPYHFKDEVESLARVDATRIGDKPIELKVDIAPDIPYELIGDKGHVKEVINNLLTNAIKYTDKGHIYLSCKCINNGSTCILFITVQDTGRGIKAENINKLFTKFERLGVEKNTTTEGTGLGLAITKKLVELMGGAINVQSQFGTGSIFMVKIPQKIGIMSKPLTDTQVIDNVAINEALKKRSFAGKRVLIVDDNKLNIKVARRALDSFNLILDEAQNGEECLKKVTAGEKYDLILMDIMMPVMSGERALEELKKISSFATPVIALTADAVQGAQEKYIEEGFTDYIAKPFNKDQISEKLNKVFND